MEESSPAPTQRRPRPRRRPERQQILLRRALALGAGLLILILLGLGIRGCLNARKEQALTDYANDVTQIVQETKRTSASFFQKLSDPGELSVTEFVADVNADRSAVDSFEARVDGLDAPGDMSAAQDSLELVYDLRAAAMDKIAERMSTALGDLGSEQATRAIAKQMRTLAASDVVYAEVTRPQINNVLEENGLESEYVPESVFLPEGEWLDEAKVESALASVSGATGAATPGVHGLGLLSTSIEGTELTPEGTTAVATEGTPEVEVQVQNQGESTENGITVTVSVDGSSLQGSISSIAAGETESVTIPLTPAPKGTVTLEVEVETVPGEQVSENNKASYTVEFE